MVHVFLSQSFLVLAAKLAVRLQPASHLSSLLSPSPQYLASLQSAIILAISDRGCKTTQGDPDPAQFQRWGSWIIEG